MAEIINRTKTADGYGSYVWSDGSITSADMRPWTMHRASLPVAVALTVNAEACLFTAEEMPHLIKAAHKLHKRGAFLPGDMRAEAARMADKSGRKAA
jgi:hypothetical protein